MKNSLQFDQQTNGKGDGDGELKKMNKPKPTIDFVFVLPFNFAAEKI